MIAVSPLRPQSQQHVAVQNLSEGQGNASGEKELGFLVIQKWSSVKDSRGGGENVKNLSGIRGASHVCVSELLGTFLSFSTAEQPVYFGLKPKCSQQCDTDEKKGA